MRKLTTVICLAIALFAWLTPTELLADNIFVKIKLSNGIQFEIPRNWTVFTRNARDTLEASTASQFVMPINTSLPFAANLYNDRRETIGIMNIRVYPNLDIHQSYVRWATKADIQDLDQELEEALREGAAKTTWLKILEWNGSDIVTIGSKLFIHTNYTRVSIKDYNRKFNVHLYRYLDGERSFTMTLSYDEASSFFLQPIIRWIANSVAIIDN